MVGIGFSFRNIQKISEKRNEVRFSILIKMAKNKIILLCFFLTLSIISLPIQNTRDRVVKIYQGEIGVREKTGQNDGERVEEYLHTVGHKKGAPWCAAFVSWVFKEAGVIAVKSAWSPAWFPALNIVYTRGANKNKIPDSGDVFGIYFQNLKRIAHVGFIDDWQQSTSFTITVEGNTNDIGSREGDGVYRKRRLKNQIYKVSRWL